MFLLSAQRTQIKRIMQKIYEKIDFISGHSLVIDGVKNIQYRESVEIEIPNGQKKFGYVSKMDGSRVTVQMLSPTQGIPLTGVRVKFLGKVPRLGVSREMLGRVFDGMGKPIDGMPAPLMEKSVDFFAQPLNPFIRNTSFEPIQTGIPSLEKIGRGQRISVFCNSNSPYIELVTQICKQAKTNSAAPFSIVMGMMGTPSMESLEIQKEFDRSGLNEETALFVNTAADSVIERISVPRMVLSLAEYLAFEKNQHVLAILLDMNQYIEALQENFGSRKENQNTNGHPKNVASELASIYERAGQTKNSQGSVTQISVFVAPEPSVIEISKSLCDQHLTL